MENKYKVKKVLNNNSLLAINNDGDEVVLVGKGIGFDKKNINSFIETDSVEKMFVSLNKNLVSNYLDMLRNVDERIQLIVSDCIFEAEKTLGDLQPRLHLVLVDHISFAIERFKAGYNFENPLIDDIKILYPEEYAQAQLTRLKLFEEYDILLPEDENAILALHYNAARKFQHVKESLRKTNTIYELIKVLEDNIEIELTDTSKYRNLVLSIEEMIYRTESGEKVFNPLKECIKTELTEAYNIASLISNKYKSITDYEISEDEISFLAIDIYKLFLLINKEEKWENFKN